jgi:hypothetical protein
LGPRSGRYALIGFRVPLRRSVQTDFIAGSVRLPRPSERYVFRSFLDLEVFPAAAWSVGHLGPTAGPCRVASPSGIVPVATSRNVLRDRLSSGSGPFVGSGPCGVTSAATPRHRRLQGSCHPLDAFVFRLGPPRSLSSGSDHGVFPFRAFPFRRVASVSRRAPTLLPFGPFGDELRKDRRLQGLLWKAVTRRGLLRRRRAAALLGFVPLQGFQPDRSLRSRGRPRRLCGHEVPGFANVASQGYPTGRPRSASMQEVDVRPS